MNALIRPTAGPLLAVAWLTLCAAVPAMAADLIIFHKYDTPPPDHLEPFVSQYKPAEDYAECDLVLTGEIEGHELEYFHAIYDYTPDGPYGSSYNDYVNNSVLCLDSTGGDFDTALEIAGFLAQIGAGLETRVIDGDTCASACSILFFAGAWLEEGETVLWAKHRSIAATANLGVHAPGIDLGDGDRYTGAAVNGAYSHAIRNAAGIFTMSQRRDTQGDPFMNTYLFQRTLETPPQDMYYIDTVGDALLADVAVTGIDIRARLDEDLIEAICDNVFMLDDGMFDWAFGPTWKRHPLASMPMIWEDFQKAVAAAWIDDADFSYDIQLEQGDGHIYGVARGYRTGGPYSAQDCLVRLDTYADIGDVDLLARQRDAYEASTAMNAIQVMIGTQFPSGGYDPEDYAFQSSPRRYWQSLLDRDVEPRAYPMLIAYPMTSFLTDLPEVEAEPAAQPEGDTGSGIIDALAEFDCDELWLRRNFIFHVNGYCFDSELGKQVFGNDECHTKSPDLDDEEQLLVSLIREMEDLKGCR